MIKAETDRKADVEPRRLRVFLCHSSDDKPAVRDLYHRLCADGLDVWLDEEKLLPGQDWKQEISKAVRAADVVIVCLSCGSVAKAGYGQKEIKFALDVADEQPEGTIFLIPLKLEKCDVPERLSRWQWVDLTAAKGYERLMRALRERAKTRGMMLVPSSTEQGAKRYVQKRLLDAARDPIWQMIGAIVAILGLAWAVSISHLDPSGSGSQTPSPEATPTPVSGNIRFSSIPNSKTLNPDLRWDAGSSERSNYTLLPDMITLTAGPETWPGFPSISYKYP
jgi:hypothetical protein